MASNFEEKIHDVIIIGAGPCGLAVAARLREHLPSTSFSDAENDRYHRQSRRIKRGRKKELTLMVIDETAPTWMSRWKRLFKAQDISHLRSPLFFHLDPSDRDSLLSYSYQHDRMTELQEVDGCIGYRPEKVGKRGRPYRSQARINEISRRDYYAPSSSLFQDHCQYIVDRYRISQSVQQGKVKDIQYCPCGIQDGKGTFTITTEKEVFHARNVVLAVGPGVPSASMSDICDCKCHSMDIERIPEPRVRAKIANRETTHVLVIGGGLSAVQIADAAIRRGVSKVWLAVRDTIRIQPFDIDLSWLGQESGVYRQEFWSADSDEERLRQIKAARNGASIPAVYYAQMKRHVEQGRLVLCEHTTVKSSTFDPDRQTWTIETDPPSSKLPAFDFIYHATGAASRIEDLPCLHSMHRDFPIRTCGGMPCLDEDLKWRKDVPLFVTGRFASLKLGPGAANLSGARTGAERIAQAVQSTKEDGDEDNRRWRVSDEGYNSFGLLVGE
ncbi:hypothetical protein MBLNU457_g0612t2 [Dothideomycetes sp. NU457]